MNSQACLDPTARTAEVSGRATSRSILRLERERSDSNLISQLERQMSCHEKRTENIVFAFAGLLETESLVVVCVVCICVSSC